MKLIHLVGMPPLYTNSFLLVGNEGHAVLIDPAVSPGKVGEALEEYGATLTHILLTHGHPDHTMTLKPIMEKYHPKLMMNLADAKRYCLTPDEGFTDFGTIQVDEMTFQTIFTPGHTKGSTVILCGGFLFSGDTLFAGDIGRTDFADSSTADMENSLKKILEHIKGNPQVLPGHEEFSTLDEERKNNPYLRF